MAPACHTVSRSEYATLPLCVMIDSSAAPPDRSRLAFVLISVLLALTAVALLLRCVSIAQPLGIDQGLWASAVRGMSRGQLLYRDVWEQRPPGIYWIYLIGFRLFGWTAATVAWLDVLAAAATTVLIWSIARSLGSLLTGAVAAALYAVLTMPAWLYGHSGFLERSVSETFIVVCIALSAWCSVRVRDTESLGLAVAMGLAAGGAVVLKPNAGLYFPALLLWMLLYRRDRPVANLGSFRRPLVAAAFGAAVVPAAAIVWVWQAGVLQEARIAVIDFNRYYVGQGFALGSYALDFSKAVWLRMKTESLWLGGGVGALAAVWQAGRHRYLPPLAGLSVIWGGTAALVIVVNGARLFNSYFIQALPPLAVLTAWVFTEWAPKSIIRRVIAGITALLMLVLLVQRQYVTRVVAAASADFDVLRGRSDRVAYLERFGSYSNRRGYSARANAELAAYVGEHTQPDDRIFLFGINGAEVYFAADRLTAHRFLRVNFFVATDFPDQRFRLHAVIDELATRRPRYLIFEQLHSTSDMAKTVDALVQDPAIIRLLSAYQFEQKIEDFTLYRLRE